MNKIEAIDVIRKTRDGKSCKSCAIFDRCYNDMRKQADDLAIKALQEKQDREKGCEDCISCNTKRCANCDCNSFSRDEYPCHTCSINDNYSLHKFTRFCEHCGRKLRKGEDNE